MKGWAFIFGFMIVLLMTFGVRAAAVPGPEEVVKTTIDTVLGRVKAQEATLKQDTSKLYALVNELIIPHFDFQRSSQLVLGKYWRAASDAQKARFTEAFKQLLVRTYANALFQYVDEKILYKPSQQEDDGHVVVRTEIQNRDDNPAPVNYRMQKQPDGEWKAYDVYVDGVSLVITYRESFASEIRQSGLDALIDHMESHNEGLATK